MSNTKFFAIVFSCCLLAACHVERNGSRMNYDALINRLAEAPINGPSLGGPYRAVTGNEITDAIEREGVVIVPSLCAALAKNNIHEVTYGVYCLRRLKAYDCIEKVKGLQM